jgi:hypothetical protein
MSDEYRAFGDGLFLSLAETTMEFAARDLPAPRNTYRWDLKPCGAHDPRGTIMDGLTLPTCAKRLALELPFTEHCWPFGPEYDVFKVGGKIFMLVTELRGRPLINLKSDPQNHC